MSNAEEKQIVEELDREISRKGSLIALVICLVAGGGMLAAAAMDVFRPG